MAAATYYHAKRQAVMEASGVRALGLLSIGKDSKGLLVVTGERARYRIFQYPVMNEYKGLTSSITLCYWYQSIRDKVEHV